MRAFVLLLAVLLAAAPRAEAQPAPGGCTGPFVWKDGARLGCGDTLDFNPSAGFTLTQQGTRTKISLSDPIRVDAYAGVDCTGATDSTAGVAAALAAAAGKTLYIRSGCRPRFASPGTTNAAVLIPGNTHILCADQTAGFAALTQRCTGGTYPGAACVTSAECLGGGTCQSDFGVAAVNPCDATTCFAPTAPNVYTLVRAAGPGVWIENCGVWVAQADPYQRCVGGANASKPCRQECDNGTTGALTPPGVRCQVNADCPTSNTCLRVADCGTPGGTCTGGPLGSSGAGDVLPLDLSFPGARIANVKIYDHFTNTHSSTTGAPPGSIAVATNATIIGVDTAGESTNCTMPLPTPTQSACGAGGCCYGAFPSFGAPGSNTQPAVNVTAGINATALGGGEALIVDSQARGVTGILAGTRARVDRSKIVPTATFGPGVPSGATAGIQVGNFGTVSNNQLVNIASGGVGINLAGTDSTASKNTILGAYATGILLAGNNDAAIRNTMKTTTGAGSGNSISITGTKAQVTHNFIESNAATGSGINVASSGGIIKGNWITSNPISTLQNGITFAAGSGGVLATQNQLKGMLQAGFWLNSAAMFLTIDHNLVEFENSAFIGRFLTPSYHPVHVLRTLGATQVLVQNNQFLYGFRGFDVAGTDGTTNTQISNNRFWGLGGATVAAGGAGTQVFNNYANVGASGGFTTLTCDASCTTRGAICMQDSECTSCNGAVQKCIPEPIDGYIGSANTVQGAGSSWHDAWIGNVLFALNTGAKQCTGTTTYIGSFCNVASAVGACGGGGTCGGGPPSTCTGGSEPGRACCLGASPTCAVRTPTPLLRIPDYGSPTHSVTDLTIASNTFFNAQSDYVMLDMLSSASLGTINMDGVTIAGNHFDGLSGPTNVTGIRFPTSGSFVNVQVNGNNFAKLTSDVTNWKGTYGTLSYTPMTAALTSDFTAADASFANVPELTVALEAARSYYFTCEVTFSSSQATNGIGLAMTAPANNTTFSYVTRLPSATVITGAGTDVVSVQEGNGNDATDAVTLGVGAAGTKYSSNIHGNLVTGAAAGNLQLRYKTELGVSVTLYKGSNCVVYQVPS